MNNLQTIYTIGRGARIISIRNWENKYYKIKIILFIIILYETTLFDKSSSRKGASVSKEFAFFNWGSVGYIWPTIFSK